MPYDAFLASEIAAGVCPALAIAGGASLESEIDDVAHREMEIVVSFAPEFESVFLF